jgi:predicted aspartyl protease
VRRIFAFSLVSAALLIGAVPAVAQQRPDRATVPLLIEKNRPYITVTLRRADGSTRAARFLVDTGGGGFLITEPLARDLGLEWGTASREEGAEFALVKKVPEALVGEFPLELNPARVLVLIGKSNVLPNTNAGEAEGMLPGHVLSRYHVVFDYPNATFTLARPGVLTPKGDASPMPVAQRSGFPRTEIEVNGEKHGFLLDTGASFTMVSDALLKKWGSDHPDWPRHPGAYGEAATLGGQTLETMFLPGGAWQSHKLGEFGVTSQREGTFERYMSQMMAAPIVGSLAGNVLKRFRVELDYANQKLYLSAQ